MKNSSKIAVVAGLGAIAGGVAGYYLNSEKGRQQRQMASETIKGKSTQVSNYAGDLADRAKSVASDIATKAQNLMTTASSKAEQVKGEMADSADRLKSKAENANTNGNFKVVV